MSPSHPGDQVDEICDDFEREWKSGQQPDVSDWLNKADEHLRNRLLPQLIRVDLEYRLRSGVSDLSLQDYVKRFGVDPGEISLLKVSRTDEANAAEKTTLGFQRLTKPLTADIPVAPESTKRFGSYVVLKQVGQGGMGVVYQARDATLGRLVALKTIRTDVRSSREAVVRFQREAKATARLNHPHLVPILDSGIDEGTPWFAMEFVDGQTLKEFVGSQPMSSRKAAELILQITQAVAHAHEQGVIHRDIKPSNVLIETTGICRLTDFGLAHLDDYQQTLTLSDQIIGTATYMSPEQASGRANDADTTLDIYSLGAVLYFLLTGRPPFQAATTAEILRQVVQEQPVAPRRLNAEVDRDLEVICLKCLEKGPTNRITSAEYLAAELQRYLDGKPIQSRAISVAGRFRRWCVRRPMVAATVFLTGLLIVGLMIAVPWILVEQSSRRQAEEIATANAARAATQEYYAGIRQVREQRLVRDPGWTWKGIETLKRLADLPADGKDPVELRSLAVQAMMSPDVRPVARFAEGVDPSDTASSSDGRYVALCETRGAKSVSVFVYEFETADAEVPQVSLYRRFEMPLKPHPSGKPDGFRSVCFSNDGSTIAAGTRHGQIFEWDLHDLEKQQPAREYITDDFTVYQLQYSPEDDILISASERPAEIRVWDRANAKCLHTFPHRITGFTSFDSEWIVFSQSHRAVIAKPRDPDSIKRLVAVDPQNGIAYVTTSGDGEILASTEGRGGYFRTFLRDVNGGTETIELVARDSELKSGQQARVCPKERFFAAGNSAVISSLNLRSVRLWDALSGEIACDYRVADREEPLLMPISNSNLFCVSGHNHSELLQLRAPHPLRDCYQCSGSANACVRVFAATAWELADFGLNEDGTIITILEGIDLDVKQRRVQTFDLNTGRATQRWTTRNLHSRPMHSKTPEQGLCISQSGVYATLSGPGYPFLLHDRGFAAVKGLKMPIAESPPHQFDDGRVEWEFAPGFEVPMSGMDQIQIYVSLNFPRPFPETGESLRLELLDGDEVMTSHELTSPAFDGWELLRVDHLPLEMKQRRHLSVRLTVKSEEFVVETGSTESNEHAIVAGTAFAVPALVLETPNYNHGIVSIQDDGNAFFVDDDLRLLQWVGDREPAVAWQDPDDTWIHIRDVASGTNSTIFGTRRGDIFLTKNGGPPQPIVESPRTRSNGDTPEDIRCLDMKPDGSFAAAGNLKGELLLLNLLDSSPLFGRVKAHSGGITEIAVSPLENYVATADAAGNLRVWRRIDDGAELLFELERLNNPVIRLRFSSDGEQLWMLRENERGLRILDLESLKDRFAGWHLGWD